MVFPIGIPGHEHQSSINVNEIDESGNPQNSFNQVKSLQNPPDTPTSSFYQQNNDLSQYAGSSVGSQQNFTFNQENGGSPGADSVINSFQGRNGGFGSSFTNNVISSESNNYNTNNEVNNNSTPSLFNNERPNYNHSGGRTSLLTSKLAKIQKKTSLNQVDNKYNEDGNKSGFPYHHRGLNNRAMSNSNLKGVNHNNNKVSPSDNSASSLSSSFKFNPIKAEYMDTGNNNNHMRLINNSTNNLTSSSYSSAPVSFGKTNHFIPISSEPKSFGNINNSFHQSSSVSNNGSFNFHFPQVAPATATTNISMETASSNTSNSNVFNTTTNNNNNQTMSSFSSSTTTIETPIQPDSRFQAEPIIEPFNAAKDIYDPSKVHETHQGITIDSKGDEHLNIVEYPPQELLYMLASLLQKIIDANDTLHPDHYSQASQLHNTNKFARNVLAFHGKNVPAIPIYNYFLRILKYCPMTNEVFLSLLVYFDRIAKLANDTSNNHNNTPLSDDQVSNNSSSPGSLEGFKPNSNNSQLFVMDSFNIHRLIIAGITVSSKFFSDVFYKNARYARVGGLPLDELNHIEVQFLLLTEFKLLIQPDELQRYADLLLKFWRREKAKAELNSNNNKSEQVDTDMTTP